MGTGPNEYEQGCNMYFLTEDERRLLFRKILPEARAEGVADDLRGWNWNRPPLCPIYEGRLSVFEVASQLCASGRDVYLRRVLGPEGTGRVARATGRAKNGDASLYHVARAVVVEAKRIIYEQGALCLPMLEMLTRLADGVWNGWAPGLPTAGGKPGVSAGVGGVYQIGVTSEVGSTTSGEVQARDNGRGVQAAVGVEAKVESVADRRAPSASLLWEFEARRVLAAVEEVLSKAPALGPDGLVSRALPVVVGCRLEGSLLGLASSAVDMLMLGTPVPFVARFGPRRDFHRLIVTGFALMAESMWECPVDIGCVAYVRFKEGQVTVERELVFVGDELRQEFVEARDEKMRLVEEEIDPGLPMECYKRCGFYGYCHARDHGYNPDR